MADEKLSNKRVTTSTSGGFLHIILPNGLGGWISRQISYVSLFASVVSRITDLENYLGAFSTSQYYNRSADFTHTMDENQKLFSIDLRALSGSPVIKMGTTAGGDEILSERTLSTGNDDNTFVGPSFQAVTVIYVTITGGNVSVTFIKMNNTFGTV